MKISQRYCLLTVRNSDLFSIYFFGRLDFFLGGGDITKISGNMTQVSGGTTSGEMTLGRLDCKRVYVKLVIDEKNYQNIARSHLRCHQKFFMRI